MGGRGSKSKANKSQSRVLPQAVSYNPPRQNNQPTTNKTQQEIIDFVNIQTGINLNDYRDSQTALMERKRSNFVNVDWNGMPRTTQQLIEQLSIRYPNSQNAISLADTSGWSKMIYFKNR